MSHSKLAQLRAAQGKLGLAIALNIQLRQLTRAIYGMPIHQRYTIFTIPKSLGGQREIYVPHGELKFAQKALARLLQDCLTEIELRNNVVRPVSHGFHPGRSIFSNAWRHRKKNYVMNFDLKDFFPSIHFGRVSKFFEKNSDFQLHPNVANLIANLACHTDGTGGTFLPQGSPCSPVISNLIAGPLDHRLRNFARKNDCNYTRYADDITFSTNCSDFPEIIAYRDPTSPTNWKAGAGITQVITGGGFVINPAKTRMSLNGTRQLVTGLVVNKQVSVDRATYKWVRAASTNFFRKDIGYRHTPSTANVHTTARLISLQSLLGQINHICYARRRSNIPLAAAREMKGPELLYKQLTYYERFFTNDKTIIICEGETDNIYLKIALDKLGSKFANLKPGADKLSPARPLNVTSHITKYTGLNGGSDQQKAFLQNYDEDMSMVGDRWAKNCVILLMDNDSGANAIMQILRGKKIIAGDIKTSDFTSYLKNLYVIFTPVASKEDMSTIEDFVDPKAKAVILDGKTFHPGGKGFSESKHYGKKVLAEKVVKSEADKYDFSGFDVILARIDAAISHYNNRVKLSMGTK